MTIMMVAMMVHIVLPILYGLVGAWIVHRFDLGVAVVIGAVHGFALYVLNRLVIAAVMFSSFAMARDPTRSATSGARLHRLHSRMDRGAFSAAPAEVAYACSDGGVWTRCRRHRRINAPSTRV